MQALEFTAHDRRWRANLAASADLAIPLDFAGPQPRFFADEPARAVPLRSGSFTGSVRDGASCNCSIHTLAPHCHGTHTEGVGHVTIDGPGIDALTPVPPALAAVISVHAKSGTRPDTGPLPTELATVDQMITRDQLIAAATPWLEIPWSTLVVRTLPNDAAKTHRFYAGPNPAPYFAAGAMQWIVSRGVTSLVVDLPSLDRADDGGALVAHRIFWGLDAGSTSAHQATRARALVTELAYVPESVADGLYLLELHVPGFRADAAPSRPVLYPVVELIR